MCAARAFLCDRSDWRIYKVVGSVKYKVDLDPDRIQPFGGQVPPHIYSIPPGDHDGSF